MGAHLQNSKANWCFMRMERSESAPRLRPRDGLADVLSRRWDAEGGEADGIEAQARAFQEGALAVDELLARGSAAARSDDAIRSKEEAQRLHEEAENRRRR